MKIRPINILGINPEERIGVTYLNVFIRMI